eukprot:15461787-Alexandrium_andersonii.AAC.1
MCVQATLKALPASARSEPCKPSGATRLHRANSRRARKACPPYCCSANLRAGVRRSRSFLSRHSSNNELP